MSFSVDDLVATFSGSHIGQEAMDLATLQTQLAQTLFTNPIPAAQDDGQLCNTPTARTPSAFSFGQRTRASSSASMGGRGRSRRGSVSVMADGEINGEVDEMYMEAAMEEDEQMVEDLLTPSSPISGSGPGSGHSFSYPPQPHHSNYQHQYQPQQPSRDSYAQLDSFTSTDPFYIAQLQSQSQSQSQSSSIFAQAGRPAQHSPFLPHTHQQQFGYVPVPVRIPVQGGF